jgi:hypothetical protein
VPDLPRTNNDLEHEFGAQRYHERRATGRKTASPAAVLRGEARLVAAIATRQRPPNGADLGCVDREQWKDLRQRLDRRRQARTLRTRFRRDPAAYLAELEQKARQLNRVHFGIVGFPSWLGVLLFPHDDLGWNKAFSDQCYELTISAGGRRLRICAIWP